MDFFLKRNILLPFILLIRSIFWRLNLFSLFQLDVRTVPTLASFHSSLFYLPSQNIFGRSSSHFRIIKHFSSASFSRNNPLLSEQTGSSWVRGPWRNVLDSLCCHDFEAWPLRDSLVLELRISWPQTQDWSLFRLIRSQYWFCRSERGTEPRTSHRGSRFWSDSTSCQCLSSSDWHQTWSSTGFSVRINALHAMHASWKHSVKFHRYADDTPFYLSETRRSGSTAPAGSLSKTKSASIFLLLNSNKAELLITGPKYLSDKVPNIS